MKVLFVSGGNSSSFDIAPFIKSQGESLKITGAEITYFTIKGKGILGYLKAAIELRKYLRNTEIDLIHAHYTLSGWSSVLSFSGKPIILSLMGTDAYGDYIGENKITFKSRYLILLTYLIQPFVRAIICKSEHIRSFVYRKSISSVIPNGIQFEKFSKANLTTREELGLKEHLKYILFLGSKKNIRKNFTAAEKAVKKLNRNDLKLISPYPVNHETALKYMQVVDLIIVPSFMEGSPNVVKEAMASNLPVVATNVGDVEWLFGDESGCFITDFNPESMALNIEKALEFVVLKGKTNGLNRIKKLGLQSEEVANKIKNIYTKTLNI